MALSTLARAITSCARLRGVGNLRPYPSPAASISLRPACPLALHGTVQSGRFSSVAGKADKDEGEKKFEEEILPQMTLSDSDNVLTAPLPMEDLSPSQRALKRFSIAGNAVVSGGAGYLGFQACKALLEHGAKGLAILDIPRAFETAEEDIAELRRVFRNKKILTRAVDVTDEAVVSEAMTEAAKELGSIDAVLCFAGILDREQAIKTTYDNWKKVLDININGQWLCAQAAARQMIAQKTGGSIMFTASISAHLTNFPQPQISYNVSKAATVHMARSLAAEWARYGIRVNSISPGYMETAFTNGDGLRDNRDIWTTRNPMGRMGDPAEVTGAVILLCSRIGGRYITGADIIVDGGQTVF